MKVHCCEFHYVNEQIVKNVLVHGKIHVEKKDRSYCHRNIYIRIFGITHHESVLRIFKSNMADPTWWTES